MKQALWLEEHYTDEKMAETYLPNIMTYVIHSVFRNKGTTKSEMMEHIWMSVREYRESRRRRDRRIKLLKKLIREQE